VELEIQSPHAELFPIVCWKILFKQFLKNSKWETLNYQVDERVPTVGAAADNFFF
jgi:hypothetical protein